jgi:hypothetical protein
MPFAMGQSLPKVVKPLPKVAKEICSKHYRNDPSGSLLRLGLRREEVYLQPTEDKK